MANIERKRHPTNLTAMLLLLLLSTLLSDVCLAKNDSLLHLPCGSETANTSPALADTQDRIDTLDQAGLYELINKAKLKLPFSPFKCIISPQHLLDCPENYRGFLLKFEVLLHNESEPLIVSRETEPPQEYVAAKITGNHINSKYHLHYPTIIILPENSTKLVDRMSLEGYFYMILRTQTQASKNDKGPKQLDYLVFVANRLTEIKDKENLSTNKETPKPYFLIGTIILVMIWIFQRRYIYNKFKRPKA